MAVRTAKAGKRKGRLTAEQRRDQLLDSAGEIIEEARTPAALTMEGLAERASVSKALVYIHFPARDDVLLGLLTREIAVRDEMLRDTLEDSDSSYQELMRRWTKGFFDFVEHRGTVLNVLLRPPREPTVERATRARHERAIDAWVAAAVRVHGGDPKVARIATELISASAVRAAEVWKEQKLPREIVERVFLTSALATTEAPPRGRPRR